MAETANPTPSDLTDPASRPFPLLIPKEVEEWMKSLNPGFFQNYKDIETTWHNPIVQFSMTLMADPVFRGSVTEIYAQPNPYGRIAAYEIGLIVLIWVFKAWRLSKAVTWMKRLWVQLWVACLFWVLSLVIIPYIAWGTPYKTAVGQLIKALIRHFF